MRNHFYILFFLLILGGCALGNKGWPNADKSEDKFKLSIINGQRNAQCLTIDVQIKGSVQHLSYANLQLEPVGDGPGQGCADCPFMPRYAKRFSRGEPGFTLKGNTLRIAFCELEPNTEYRFRIVGVNDLSTIAYEYTDIFVASP